MRSETNRLFAQWAVDEHVRAQECSHPGPHNTRAVLGAVLGPCVCRCPACYNPADDACICPFCSTHARKGQKK